MRDREIESQTYRLQVVSERWLREEVIQDRFGAHEGNGRDHLDPGKHIGDRLQGSAAVIVSKEARR